MKELTEYHTLTCISRGRGRELLHSLELSHQIHSKVSSSDCWHDLSPGFSKADKTFDEVFISTVKGECVYFGTEASQ